ncbi:sensor histidine kinase [Streptacidiphilus fuscans]|uniref:histidine kinase n=1 Tax=Streptacidiphilus fuscans TaxID=2789292 RepID=A0A931BHF4_9ACTN|nr:HAMP domain-containing sensor histidine kinase [Streptacidiphilus fuscans]MBF9073515.1 HAMP domain-containing histidine kinase [Streptacidiphilus fuscans]
MKLSTRIALSVSLTVPLLVLAAGALLLGLVGHDITQQQDTRLRTLAVAVTPDVRSLLAADRAGRPRAAQNQNRRVLDSALDSGVLVLDPNGTTVLSGGPQPGPTVVLPAPTGRPETVAGFHALGESLAQGGTLWVFAPVSADNAQLSAIRGRVLLVALLAAPLAGLLTLALARRATRSLGTLSAQASALDPRDGADSFRHRTSHITEVDDLAAALSAVLSRYDQQATRTGEALETARSFASAASHELRTPLMSMQTNLDVLATHGSALAPDEREEIVADLRGEHGRLLELLTALRTLARGDLVEAEAFTDLDFGELVDSCVQAVARSAPEAQLMLSGGYGLRVRAWEPGLKILVTNLLTNAVVHGHAPGEASRIAVTLTAAPEVDGGHAVLTVDDWGPGIPASRRGAVFDRFTRGQDSPGTGLGLTLVAQQTALHGGTITISEAPGGHGTRFCLRLPLSGTPFQEPTHRNWLTQTLNLKLMG